MVLNQISRFAQKIKFVISIPPSGIGLPEMRRNLAFSSRIALCFRPEASHEEFMGKAQISPRFSLDQKPFTRERAQVNPNSTAATRKAVKTSGSTHPTRFVS
jgi:hypothetical protein